MRITTRPYTEIPQLSDRDKAYQAGAPALRPYYQYDADLDTFAEVIDKRRNYNTDRLVLRQVIEDQYKALSPSPVQQQHISSLDDEHTFTIVTAHQPSLLTGPLYYIYKIAGAIHLCRRLAERYPNYRFVPVFINGSEDHDFEEVNHVHLFGDKHVWVQEQGGPVGRLSIDTLKPVLAAITDVMGSSTYADDARTILNKAVQGSTTYNDFSQVLVQELFGQHGLIAINMDDVRLKRLFIPLIKREIFEQFSHDPIEATQAKLATAGYKSQAFPRDINFFYLGEGYRERIVLEGGMYRVHNQDIRWSAKELDTEIDKHPERFSPNVNMRPLYQEVILPNLAYIGGGGELAYWMERLSQFEAAGVPYPMLIRRNSVLLLDRAAQRTMDKLDISEEQLWLPEHVLVDHLLKEATEVNIDVHEEQNTISEAYDAMARRASLINAGLGKYVLAEKTKQLKQIEQIGSRLKREIKSREDIKVKQLQGMLQKLYPNHGLQERHDNIWQYYLTYGPDLITFLIDHLDPLDKGFMTISLD